MGIFFFNVSLPFSSSGVYVIPLSACTPSRSWETTTPRACVSMQLLSIGRLVGRWKVSKRGEVSLVSCPSVHIPYPWLASLPSIRQIRGGMIVSCLIKILPLVKVQIRQLDFRRGKSKVRTTLSLFHRDLRTVCLLCIAYLHLLTELQITTRLYGLSNSALAHLHFPLQYQALLN